MVKLTLVLILPSECVHLSEPFNEINISRHRHRRAAENVGIGFIDFHIFRRLLWLPLRRRPELLLLPTLLALRRTPVPQRGMHPAVIVPTQPGHNRVLGLPYRVKMLAMQPLYFQRTKQRLAASVVPAVALATHRSRHAILAK